MSGSNLHSMFTTIKKHIISFTQKYCGCLSNLSVSDCFATGRKTPKFSCIAIATNSLSQCYSHDIRYHNRIRYAYFNADARVRNSVVGGKEITFRILTNDKTATEEVDRFVIDFSQVSMTDTIVNNEQVEECYEDGKSGSLIIRLPFTRPDGIEVVYIYDRNNRLDT